MLTLWKRHSATCKKVNEKEFRSLDPDQHRFFKNCQCACWITGNHPKTDQYLKESLKTTSWEAGLRLKAELEGNTPGALAAKRMTIEKGLAAWIADKARIGVSASTRNTMYRTFEVSVLNFAKDYGVTLISQLDVAAVRALIVGRDWATWKRSTFNRQLTNLRSFFKYCIECEWIEKNPALSIKRGPDDFEQVDSYRSDELDRLEVAFGNWTEKIETRQGQWAQHPEALHCLKHVLEDTGLRISDALQARPAVIRELPTGDGEWTLMQNKKDGLWTRKHAEVTVYLRRSTLEEMKRIPWVSEKYPFMPEPRKTDREAFKQHLHSQGICAYLAFQKVGEVAGVANCRPHRFRHTFTAKARSNGKSMEKTAHLLGHLDTKTLQKHYSKWTEEHQEQVREERLRDFANERSVQPIDHVRKVG